jgi:hypothetical protein
MEYFNFLSLKLLVLTPINKNSTPDCHPLELQNQPQRPQSLVLNIEGPASCQCYCHCQLYEFSCANHDAISAINHIVHNNLVGSKDINHFNNCKSNNTATNTSISYAHRTVSSPAPSSTERALQRIFRNFRPAGATPSWTPQSQLSMCDLLN